MHYISIHITVNEHTNKLNRYTYFCKKMNLFNQKYSLKTFLITGAVICMFFTACRQIQLFEKTVSIPQHQWASSFRPQFEFDISDSTTPYNIFLVIRHSEKYNYSNIFLNLYIKGPGSDSTVKVQKEALLATNAKGWLGTGMNDIYEHRVLLAPNQQLKTGKYSFTLEQIMRENPLNQVLNVGLRVEKAY